MRGLHETPTSSLRDDVALTFPSLRDGPLPLPQGEREFPSWLRAFIVVVLLALASPALAVLPSERLADPALEARARALGAELRCLVCQNQSIDDSNADLAHDLRVLVRKRLAAGDSDQQVLEYLTSRYGDYVLLKPPLRPATWLLWFGPAALLAGGGVALALARRRGGASGEPAPLSAEERQRLARLLGDEAP